MIGCKHFLWLHVMKTGGQWLRQAVLPQFPPRWGIVHVNQHVTLERALSEHPSLKGNPTWCHVRNPWDWYRSMFTFMKQHWEDKTGGYILPRQQWGQHCAVWDYRFKHGWSFADYLHSCHAGELSNEHGQSFSHHFRHVGGFDVDHVVRHERLRAGTEAMLQRLCGPLPAPLLQALRQEAPRNTSRHRPTPAYYTPELIEVVRELDREIIDRFGYEPPKLH